MTAVATNNDEVESTIYPKMSTPNRDLIIKAARVLREALELYDHAGQWAPVWQWNDNSSRSQVIEGLKRAEKYAKERHL